MCLDALIRRQKIQVQERSAAGEKWSQDSDFVFTSRNGARIVIEKLGRELDAALELAKLPHVRFHDLRHSTASLLLAHGVDMKTVQLILGHSNYQITADTYTHVLPSVLKDAMTTMNSIFSPVVAPVVALGTHETIQ
jgi:integrase